MLSDLEFLQIGLDLEDGNVDDECLEEVILERIRLAVSKIIVV